MSDKRGDGSLYTANKILSDKGGDGSLYTANKILVDKWQIKYSNSSSKYIVIIVAFVLFVL